MIFLTVELRALPLLESYLENREQCVAIGESRSEPTALQYGVPQGSVLGPVLFSVHWYTCFSSGSSWS